MKGPGGFEVPKSVYSFCMQAERLIVFVKAPRVGTVKSRIARTAGAERACAIYRQLVETVAGNLSAINQVQLHFSPDDAATEIAPWCATIGKPRHRVAEIWVLECSARSKPRLAAAPNAL
jgi:hypothetical protein